MEMLRNGLYVLVLKHRTRDKDLQNLSNNIKWDIFCLYTVTEGVRVLK